MMNKALIKNTLRTVSRTKGRFLAIFSIIALGSGFFAGVKVTSPDMKYTADRYYADAHLADLHLKSDVGFSNVETELLRLREDVRGFYAGYSTTCFLPEGDAANSIVSLYSMDFSAAEEAADDTVNLPVLKEGRYPTAPNECLIEHNTPEEYQIGDTLTVLPGSSDTVLSDTLAYDTYTVVGEADWAMFVDFERGTTTIGNGKVNSFLLVPEEAFALDVRTDVYFTLADTRGLSAFSDAYTDAVDDFTTQLKLDAPTIYAHRAEELRKTGEKQLEAQEDAFAAKQHEYDAAKAEFDRKMADAAATLAESEALYTQGKTEYGKNLAAYESGMTAYADAEAELKTQKATLDDQRKSIDAQRASLNAATKQGSKIQSVVSSYLYACTPKPFDDTTAALIESSKALDSNALSFSEVFESYISEPVGTAAKQRYYSLLWTAIGNYTAQLDSQQTKLRDAEASLSWGEKKLAAAQTALKTEEKSLTDAKTKLDTAAQQLEESELQISSGKAALETQRSEGQAKLDDAKEKLDDGAKALADAHEALTDISVNWFYLDRSAHPGYAGFEEDANRVDSIAAVFPIFFILVAALVCLTTMTRMVEEQRTEIGTLRALGYSRGTIMAQYLLYSAAASLLGVFAGMAICTNLFPRVIFEAYKLMYHYPDVICQWRWDYVFGSLAVALLCTAAASLGACWRVLVSVPAQLMRPRPPKSGKRVLLERCTPLWKHLSFNIKITARNVFRYKSRVLMTVIGVAGCTALMLTGFGLKNAISVIVDLQFDEIFRYDVVALYDSDADADVQESLRTNFADDEAVTDSLDALQKSATVHSDAQTVSATLFVPEDTDALSRFVNLRTRQGHDNIPLTEDGVVINEKLAKLLDVDVGDSLSFDDTASTVTIAAITENYVFHYVYLTPGQYETLFGDYAPNCCFGRLADGADEDALSARLLENDSVLGVSYTDGSGDNFRDLVQTLNYIVLLIICSSGALAFVVLYNLANINITERLRELATIKVLGFHDGEVAAYIYRENTVTALLGMIAGLVLGVFLSHFVITTSEIDAVMFYPVLPAHAFVLAALLTVVFTVLVNALLYFKLRRIDMAGSMKAIE